jgi:hypothetical protein
MRPARSQEQEDEADTELSQEYRLHHFPRAPTAPTPSIGALIFVGSVVLLVLVALVLGFRDEVRFLLGLFR